MKPVYAALAAILALVVGAPLATASAAPAAGHSAKPIEYRSRTLANGLRVYSVRDPSTANVSVQVWYGVGSKDDPRGRSGFAHLFEHLMFKQTRNLANEQFDRLTEDVGGYNNASTNDDYTDYFEVVPANHLERILWAEAERMSNLVVDDKVFKSERDVVKEELRQRVLAQPYGKLFYILFPEISYARSPYGRPGIGSIEDLDAATVEDVRAVHATYYRPDNATLFVVGNFDDAEFDRWVDKYFGPVARPATPLPRVTTLEPRRSGPVREWTVYEPNTPLPAVLVSYPYPAASSPDIPALMVADAILGKGESSRLYHSLVYEQQLAQSAFTFLGSNAQPNAMALIAIMAGGKTAEQGEAALRAEVGKLSSTPVTAAELAEAKNELVSDALREQETADGKARALARAVVLDGDAAEVNRLIGQIQAVTAADIQRVARTYLADDQRAVIHYLPEEGKPADAPSYATLPTVESAPLAPPADMRVVVPAPEGERIAPPAPTAPIQLAVAAPAERRLANGLRVIVSPDRDLPLVSADLVIGFGGAADPQALPGVANMTAALVTKGTRTRSATQIAQQIEALGGELDAAAGYDGSSLSLTVKSDQLDPAMAIFADVARNPTFAPEELERQRRQAIDDLEVAMSDPAELASFAAARAVYGAEPYGRPLGGTVSSLKAMTPAQVADYHHTYWNAGNATLVLTGDITPEQGFALAERLFGDWPKPPPMPPVNVTRAEQSAPRVIVIDLPKSGQAAVAVTRPAMNRRDPGYYPALVANNVLGGGYSARLNQEIRIKRGLSYGARSAIAFRRDVGPLVVTTQTKNESAVEVVDLIMAELRRLGAEPVGPTELTAREAVLIGGFGRSLETTEGYAGLLGNLSLYGVDLGEVGRYVGSVSAVTPDQVLAAGRNVFDPSQASIIVAGDASVFLEELKAKHPNVEVIKAEDLNLDSPSLK
jgi:zinc protease